MATNEPTPINVAITAVIKHSIATTAGELPAGATLARMKRNHRVAKGNIIWKNTLILTVPDAAVDAAFGDGIAIVLVPDGDTLRRVAVPADSFESIEVKPAREPKEGGDEASS